MKILKSHKYFELSVYTFLVITLFVLFFSHILYLNASTSAKGITSFFSDTGSAIVDISKTFYNELTISDIDLDRIDIPVYQLFVREDNLDKLDENLPEVDYLGITHAPREKVPGFFVAENETIPVNVRYRGDNFFHWRFPKKSWRVKLKNKQLFDGFNKLNFINPKYDSHMNTLLPYWMSHKIGLLAPRSYYSAIFLNNKYNGVSYYTDQIDETFLRVNDQLPGNIYQGEIGDELKYLFDDPELWEIVATPQGDSRLAKEELKYFLNSINSEDSNEFYNFFNRHLGKDYLKFEALKILVASPQPDQYHNHKIYLNPSNGVFSPIVWDFTPFLGDHLNLSLEFFNNPLSMKIGLNPKLLHERNKILYEFIEEDLNEDKLIDQIDEWEKLIDYEMDKDPFKDSFERPYVLTTDDWHNAVSDLKDNVKSRLDFIRYSLEDASATLYVVDSEGLVIFDVSGESSVLVEKLSSNGDCDIDFIGKNFTTNGCEFDQLMYPGRLINGLNWKDIFSNSLVKGVMRYEFQYDGIVKDIDLKMVNAITGNSIEPKIIYLDSLEDLPENNLVDSIHPWDLELESSEDLVIEEDVILHEDLFIGKNSTLRIKPGVTIKLDKGVSIIVYGQIVVEGEKGNLVSFVPYSSSPWGSIVIQSLNREESKSNIFDYCVVEGGSGGLFDHVKYTGQVSVYNSKAIFNNCKFSNNRIEDDNINAKNSYVEIINSEILDSNSDGIDFDLTEGKIINNLISDSGNDAIDLMGSSILIDKNKITRAGDKGISVGERSNPKITNNWIINTENAIAIKDSSEPIISNNVIMTNNVAISAYHKNWRYPEGGKGKIYKNLVKNNKFNYQVDKLSISNSSSLEFIEGIY